MSNVLVIDDDPNIRSLLQLLLEMHGYQVQVGRSGNEALRILGGSYRPDILLLDFEMEGINGFELLRRLRGMDHTRNMPVIMMSATTKDIGEAIQFDATYYLRKPFANDNLIQLVKKALPDAPEAPAPASAPRSLEIECGPIYKPSRVVQAEVRPPAPEPPHAPAAAFLSREPERVIPIEVRSPAPELIPVAAAAPIQEPNLNLSDLDVKAPDRESERVIQDEVRLPAPKPVSASAAEPSWELDLNLKQLIMRTGDVQELFNKGEHDWGENSDKNRLMTLAKEYSPLVRMVDEILADGIGRGASDIHLEPQEEGLCVRMRKDGLLQPILELPEALSRKIAARLKIMANLDISERRVPQDGRFSVTAAHGQKIEVRVSTLPSIYGEKIVLRLLNRASAKLSWDSLGLTPRDRGCIDTVLRAPQGLILVTGPTGSGKTTTLYTMLSSLNTKQQNIVTAEDPIEYRLPGITQVAVNSDVGLSFDKVLRSFLRQDPNIILVGEMRDLETAEIGLRAAVTGHLVLSTLHTNSAPATIARLINMGVKPYMIIAGVRLIIAQRLIRILCPHCKTQGILHPDETALLAAQERAALGPVYRAQGCKACDGIGYAGRRPIFEVMSLASSAIRKAILEGDEEEICRQAVLEGMTRIKNEALDFVAAGLTSPEEAFKVLFSH